MFSKYFGIRRAISNPFRLAMRIVNPASELLKRGSRASAKGTGLQIEFLEDRMNPATFDIASGNVVALAAALAESNSNGQADVINLAANSTYAADTSLAGTESDVAFPVMTLDHNSSANTLTINGYGSTIVRSSAGGVGLFRLMSATGNGTTVFNLTVNDVTFQNGLVASANSIPEYGGAVFLQDASATFTNCRFIGNHADFGGAIGAISTVGNSSRIVELKNCEIRNNGSVSDGGGIFNQGSALRIAFDNCTVAGNVSDHGAGGGIWNAEGKLFVNASTFSKNRCTFERLVDNNYGGTPGVRGLGGGAFCRADLTLTNSTFDGNEAGIGGGLAAPSSHTGGYQWLVNFATITNNAAHTTSYYGGPPLGAGLYRNDDGGPILTLSNSIVATNLGGADFSGTAFSGGYNLIGGDPKLGPLKDNGGVTFTRAILRGSPAIDMGNPNNSGGPSTDQRGRERLANGVPDIGAFELQLVGTGGHVINADSVVGRDLQSGVWWAGISTGSSFDTIAFAGWEAGDMWADMATADFNGDGLADLAARDKRTGSWQVGLTTQETELVTSSWTVWSPEVPWLDVRFGDLNGDGRADIVGRDAGTGVWWGALSVYSPARGDHFETSVWSVWSANVSWQDVKLADSDGNGKLDLIGREPMANTFWIGLSNGTKFATSYWGYLNPQYQWVDARVADFNNDGKADVAMRNLYGQIYVLQSDGSRFTAQKWGAWATNVAWLNVDVGDFDGDGKPDLIGRNANTGQWSVARSTGRAFSEYTYGNWSVGVDWLDIQILDVDHNGKSDVVGRIRDNGQWWAAKSDGGRFTNSIFGVWSPYASWSTVRHGVLVNQ